uniref:Helicase C-terminal domain-containing protein n=1 Tax=Anisakis simplex TaxID=6269 RepID=A0A0M3K1T2_ANISI
LEPCKFFNYHEGGKPVWLTRADLRRLENALKTRFLEWLKTEPKKMNSVLDKLGCNVQQQLDYRSRPFDQVLFNNNIEYNNNNINNNINNNFNNNVQRSTALKSIVPLIMELRDKEMLPAICFNDDRKVCEQLADKLFEYLEAEQHEFEESDEFKSKYAIKDEEKMMKLTKRKRDVKEKAKVTKKKGGEKDRDEERDNRETPQDTNEEDPLAAKKLRLNQILERFKLRSQQRDEDLFTKMTDRLNRGSGRFRDSTRLLLKLFERGIGFHHEGLNAAERIAVEILFRSGQLAMIFSTSTLALGMNMPCKSVIFGVDHPLLTPLQFRQMSGRAGRRGYDRSGTVIFMSIPTSKIRRLLTASLSTLRGNVPFTASFILRLFSYVHQKTDAKGNHSFDIILLFQSLLILIFSKNELMFRISFTRETALTLLENSFALFTRSEMRDALQKQIKLFTLFSVQLLRSLELLNEKGEPKGMASIVCHLSAHEPGNLLFIHLLQNGKFHAFCKQYTTDRNKLKSLLIVVFANLFTNRRLPLGWNPDDKDSYPSGGDSRVYFYFQLFERVVEC